MIPVKVKFYGTIKTVVKDTQLSVDLPDGATVKDLLAYLTEKFGEAFSTRVLDSKGRMQSYVRMYVNEDDVDNDNLTTVLERPGPDSPAEVLVYVVPTYSGGA